MSKDDLLSLSPEERLNLISALWESLGEAPPLTPAQSEELNARLRSFDLDRADAVSWDDLKQGMAGRTQG